MWLTLETDGMDPSCQMDGFQVLIVLSKPSYFNDVASVERKK